MNKLYNKQTWHNNTTPAINEDNLNHMEDGIDAIDSRLVEISGTLMETIPEILEMYDDIETLTKNPPYIGTNGNWYVWSTETGAYVDSGVDASITVTIADVTMLSTGSQPYVTNTGTNTDPVFHLFIPYGDSGGVTGVKGSAESTYRTGNVNLTKANIGLGNVDNTSDANKPVSTATQTALDGKVPNTRTVNGHALSSDVSVTASDVGLGNVDNTSDLNKPISTATQTALNGKFNKTGGRIDGDITLGGTSENPACIFAAHSDSQIGDPTNPIKTGYFDRIITSDTIDADGSISTTMNLDVGGNATIDGNLEVGGDLSTGNIDNSDHAVTIAGVTIEKDTSDNKTAVTADNLIGDTSASTAAFTQDSTRTNIASGASLSTLFGKIKKWFADLGTAAFKNSTTSVTQNSSDLVTSGAVWTAIDNLPEPMIFKGSLGTGGTITSLPTASSANIGFTYKVITAGTYASQSAKVGDLFISDGASWVYIPSADEPSGTVTSVGVSNGGGITVSGGPVTSSGTITVSHADTSSQASVNNSGRTYIQDITLDTYGHVTGIASATETVTNTDTKVTQTNTADTNADYRILFSENANDTTQTVGARKNTNLKYNPSTGNLQTTKLNGVDVGSSPKFTDTTYESKSAASGGTALSLVTTGEKYTWNNKISGVKGNAESSYRTGNVNITKANIGLGNVDNTSDASKPISTATQTALNGKLDKAGGTMTGALTVPSINVGSVGQIVANETNGLLALLVDYLNKVQIAGLTVDTEGAISGEVDNTPTANSNKVVKSGGIKTYVDTETGKALPKAGGTMTGDIVLGVNGEGDSIGIFPASNSTDSYIGGSGSRFKDGYFSNLDLDGDLSVDGNISSGGVFIGDLTGDVTGNASSADKIGTATVGSATQPVYINGGVPTAIGKNATFQFTSSQSVGWYTLATFPTNASIVLRWSNGVQDVFDGFIFINAGFYKSDGNDKIALTWIGHNWRDSCFPKLRITKDTGTGYAGTLALDVYLSAPGNTPKSRLDVLYDSSQQIELKTTPTAAVYSTVLSETDRKKEDSIITTGNIRQAITTGTPTNINTNVSFVGGIVQKTGNIVCVNLVFKVTSAWSPARSSEVFCKLPFGSAVTGTAAALTRSHEDTNNANTLVGVVFVNSNGDVQIGTSPYNFVQNRYIRIYGTYMTND